MCGIFGVILKKDQDIFDIIINGLTQLQNRGYDSTGLCLLDNEKFIVYKYASTDDVNALDKLKNNKKHILLNKNYIGFGHNRWATHGIKNDINAHPHLSNSLNFALVHNGIIENYNELKDFLISKGYIFYSQTDTEIIVNLIEFNYNLTRNVFNSIKDTINLMEGTYGLIVQSIYENDTLYCVKKGSPILIGKNEDKVIITSEQNGFCGMIKDYIILEDKDICIIKREEENEISINTKLNYKTKKAVEFDNYLFSNDLYDCMFLKEIYEQPETVLKTLNKGIRIKNKSEVKLSGLDNNIDVLTKIENIIILGCGSSYFAGLYGMHYFKELCNFNTVQVFDGAEFEEYDIPKKGYTAFILVSQSGETKDLHRCLDISKKNNIITIGVINVVDSLIAREVNCGVYCNAGREVGVAATKTFTSQLVSLSLISVWFSFLHKINEDKRIKLIEDLQNLSSDISKTLDICKDKLSLITEKIMNKNNIFILGKGTDEYIAKEGSLKIKEVTYIHSEGYSSSSLKHGPFALLDSNFPVILLNLSQKYNSKILNCCQEILSRKSPIFLITNNKKNIKTDNLYDVILIPDNKSFSSLVGLIPLQLLAYKIAVNKGINPDKPKNLAKVVTVE